MTINQLHKITSAIIAQGAGRRGVCISKETFTHTLESDGATILSVEHAALEIFTIADDDGGTAVDSKGREKTSLSLVLGGNEGCGVALHNANWIAVEDRVPGHFHSVLGYVTSGPLVKMDPMIDCVSYDPDKKEWHQSTGLEDAIVKVSHWMPLPYPPFKSTRRRW